MSKTGYINGSDLLCRVNQKYYAHCTTHTLSLSGETKTRAVKPKGTEPISNGKFQEKVITNQSATITAEGLCFYEETEGGFKAIAAVFMAGDHVPLELMERGCQPYLTGNFVCTSLEETASANEDVTYKATFENDGAFAYDPSKRTGEGVDTVPPLSAPSTPPPSQSPGD